MAEQRDKFELFVSKRANLATLPECCAARKNNILEKRQVYAPKLFLKTTRCVRDIMKARPHVAKELWSKNCVSESAIYFSKSFYINNMQLLYNIGDDFENTY